MNWKLVEERSFDYVFRSNNEFLDYQITVFVNKTYRQTGTTVAGAQPTLYYQLQKMARGRTSPLTLTFGVVYLDTVAGGKLPTTRHQYFQPPQAHPALVCSVVGNCIVFVPHAGYQRH